MSWKIINLAVPEKTFLQYINVICALRCRRTEKHSNKKKESLDELPSEVKSALKLVLVLSHCQIMSKEDLIQIN